MGFTSVIFVLLASLALCRSQLSGLTVYITTDTPSGHPEVALLPANLSTTTPTLLTNFTSWNQYPRLSHDEGTLVFASGVEYGHNAEPTLTHLFVLSLAHFGSSDPVRLTTNNNDLNEFAADWSPDNTHLVVEYSLHNTSAGAAEDYSRLAVVRRDGSGWTQLMPNTHKGYNDYFARWNPQNADQILFVSDRLNDSSSIYIYEFSTDVATMVPSLPSLAGATGNAPTWAADGKSFYFEAEFDGGDVYMVQSDINGVVSKLFPLQLVDTPSASGVIEYIQCQVGPLYKGEDDNNSQTFCCAKSSENGDSIAFVNITGVEEMELTVASPHYAQWMPDWK